LPAAPTLIEKARHVRGKTAEDNALLELIDPVAEAAGFEIVRLRLMGGDRARRLQIMAERPDGEMPISDCARLARAVSQVLDAADPIRGEYALEVSSPGIDRPLTRLKDFAAFAGCHARLELDRPLDGRKRFSGEIAGLAGDQVAIKLDDGGETVLLPFAQLGEARLVIDENLLQRGAAARAARLAHTTTD
jgi:ribosome maturation factor RimP